MINRELGLQTYVLLAEDYGYFKNWEGKYSCEVVLCDLKKENKDKKQIELLRNYLPPQEFEKLKIYGGFEDGADTFFEKCARKYPYIMQLFYDAREKEMGEITRNHSKESLKPIVVIIGHYHARKDSEVHKIPEKEKIDHICMWNEEEVKSVTERISNPSPRLCGVF